jgi:hypothetical protein
VRADTPANRRAILAAIATVQATRVPVSIGSEVIGPEAMVKLARKLMTESNIVGVKVSARGDLTHFEL